MKIQNILFAVVLIVFQNTGSTQSNLDSLKAIYPKQTGKARALTLSELCYQYASKNVPLAISYGRKAEQAAIQSKDSVLIAHVWNDWSIAYLYQGNYDSVIVLMRKAIRYNEALGDEVGVAKNLNKMANAHYELGKYDKALHANLKAIQLFKKNGLEHFTGQIISNIGSIYERNGDLRKGIDYHKQAAQIALKYNNDLDYANAICGRAQAEQKLENYQVAANLFKEASLIYETYDADERLANVFVSLGINMRMQGNSVEGVKNYTKALQLYDTIGIQSGSVIAAVNLGHCYLDLKLFDEAEKYLKRGLELAKKTNSYFDLGHAYQGLSQLESLRGNFKKAISYFDAYDDYKDSIFSAESKVAIADMQVKYETQLTRDELEKFRLKSQNRTLWIGGLTISLVFLSGIVAFLLLRRKSARQKAEIEQLKSLEKERSRIARDLHDNLGAELSIISARLDQQIYNSTAPAEQEVLQRISNLAKDANSSLRETVWSIHQKEISLQELHDKVFDYCAKIFGNGTVNWSLKLANENKVLSPSLALHLYRIIQESINNVSKYADANTVCVRLAANQIQIEDDGVGFDLQRVKKGYGLNNMHERALEILGEITWNSSSKGTRIAVDF